MGFRLPSGLVPKSSRRQYLSVTCRVDGDPHAAELEHSGRECRGVLAESRACPTIHVEHFSWHFAWQASTESTPSTCAEIRIPRHVRYCTRKHHVYGFGCFTRRHSPNIFSTIIKCRRRLKATLLRPSTSLTTCTSLGPLASHNDARRNLAPDHEVSCTRARDDSDDSDDVPLATLARRSRKSRWLRVQEWRFTN